MKIALGFLPWITGRIALPIKEIKDTGNEKGEQSGREDEELRFGHIVCFPGQWDI